MRLSSTSTNIGAPEFDPRIQNPTPRYADQSCGTHVDPSVVKLSITTAHDDVSKPNDKASLPSAAPGRPASATRSNDGTLPAPCAANHPTGGTAAGSPSTSSASKSSTTSWYFTSEMSSMRRSGWTGVEVCSTPMPMPWTSSA